MTDQVETYIFTFRTGICFHSRRDQFNSKCRIYVYIQCKFQPGQSEGLMIANFQETLGNPAKKKWNITHIYRYIISLVSFFFKVKEHYMLALL